MRKFVLSILFLMFWLVGTMQAATRYVKPAGSDGADGTSWATAWATIDKVNSSITGGDTVFFGPGSWFNSTLQVPQTGGSSSDSTFFISGDGASNTPSKYAAHLYGGDSLIGWVQDLSVGPDVYKCHYTAPKYNYYDAGFSDEVYALYQNYGGGYVDSPLVKWTGGKSDLSSPGRYYYSPTLDTLWVYCYNLGAGYNPTNNYGIFPCQNRNFVSNGTAKYAVARGFVFKYGNHMPVYFGNDNHGEYTRVTNCLIWAGGTNRTAGDNSSLVGSLGQLTDAQAANRGHCNMVDSCEMGVIWEIAGQNGGAETWMQMGGVDIYSESAFVTLGNNVHTRLGYGIWYKGATPVATPGGPAGTDMCGASIIAVNTIHDIVGTAIGSYYCQPYDSIIGNVLYNIPGNGINLEYYKTYGLNGGPVYCYNNTLFNISDRGIAHGNGSAGTFPLRVGAVKYNIIAQTGMSGDYPSLQEMDCQIANQLHNVDSNLYWTGTGGRSDFYRLLTTGALGCPSPAGPSKRDNLAWWSTYDAAGPKQAFDVHSSFANPGFSDTANHNFARLSAPSEIMTPFTFRGVTFSRLGAWQPSSCCVGTTGNVDGDPADMVDVSDLDAMVYYLFFGGSLSSCFAENDVDESGSIDNADLQAIIDFLFFGYPLPNCP